MAWDHRHGRGEVLCHVGERLDELALRDAEDGPGALQVALDCPGVPDTFADDVDLVAALLLRWHARLSARLDVALEGPVADRPAAAARAWVATAADRPGVRRLLDEQLAAPSSPRMQALLHRAQGKERALLARAAGAVVDEQVMALAATSRGERGRTVSGTSTAFVQRLRALIPA